MMLEIIKQNRSKLGNDFTSKLLQEVGGRLVYLIEEKYNQSKYILKFLGNDKKDELKKAVEVTNYVFDKGFKYLPRVIKDDNGNLYVEVDNGIWFITEYIEGEHPAWSEETFMKFAKLISELHNIPTNGINHYSNWNVTNERNNLNENKQKHDLSNVYQELVDKIPDFEHLPKCIIHTDVHVNNAIQSHNGDIYFIDCDALAIGTRIFDLGFFITQQFINLNLEFNAKRAKSFFQEYENSINEKLTENEKHYIIDAGLFYSLAIVPYGDKERNMKRIEWIDNNREMIYKSIF